MQQIILHGLPVGKRLFCRVPFLSIAYEALFIEIHPNSDRAPCNGPNMLCLEDLPEMLAQIT